MNIAPWVPSLICQVAITTSSVWIDLICTSCITNDIILSPTPHLDKLQYLVPWVPPMFLAVVQWGSPMFLDVVYTHTHTHLFSSSRWKTRWLSQTTRRWTASSERSGNTSWTSARRLRRQAAMSFSFRSPSSGERGKQLNQLSAVELGWIPVDCRVNMTMCQPALFKSNLCLYIPSGFPCGNYAPGRNSGGTSSPFTMMDFLTLTLCILQQTH